MAQLVHTGAGSAVTHVWVRGRPLLEEGRLTTLDETLLHARVTAWRDQIATGNP
jgi:5-methylthioadenosine/S-adenosylhomocysteine deaminase